MRSQEDWRAERAEAARVANARRRAEDMQDAMALRGEARPTLSERFREWAALEELEAREDDGRRARRAEEQLAARTARVAEFERELEEERRAHRPFEWLASDRLDGWRAARDRAAQGHDDEGYARNYVSVATAAQSSEARSSHGRAPVLD
jgi:hypothetical protein